MGHKEPAQKPLWTSFPKRSSGLAHLALGFWLAGCHLASVAAVTLRPPHLELRPSWLPARLGRGHLPFSSGPRRGEGANPSSHRMADDLGDPEDYRNLAFCHPQGVICPRSPAHSCVGGSEGGRRPWAGGRRGSPGLLGRGGGRMGSRQQSLSAREILRGATGFLKHKQYGKAETFTCNRETFIL